MHACTPFHAIEVPGHQSLNLLYASSILQYMDTQVIRCQKDSSQMKDSLSNPKDRAEGQTRTEEGTTKKYVDSLPKTKNRTVQYAWYTGFAPSYMPTFSSLQI